MRSGFRIRRRYTTLLNRSSEQHHPAWRALITSSLVLTGAILSVYSTLLVWTRFHSLSDGSNVAIYSGTCSRTARMTSVAQVLTNAIATTLFAAGSYAAQVILCPTREETDKAHAEGKWVHIGASGFRNMKWIPKSRLTVCLVLYLNAFFLHFFHNSSIFSSVMANDSMAALVTEAFTHGSMVDEALVTSFFEAKAAEHHDQYSLGHSASQPSDYFGALQEMQNDTEALTKLSPTECRSAFSSIDVPSEYSNVLVVTSASNTNAGSFVTGDLQLVEMRARLDPKDMLNYNNWFNTSGNVALFHDRCSHVDFDFGDDDVWNLPVWDYYCTATAYPVTHCLAQQYYGDCGTYLNTRIFLAATASVLVQFICLILVVCTMKFCPLATVGDAAASFIERSDPTAANLGIVSVKSIHTPSNRFTAFGFVRSNEDIAYWKKHWPTWRAAVDTEFCSLMILSLFLIYFALATATLILFNDGTTLHTYPISLLSPLTNRSIIPSLLLLSLPHIVISVTYIFYNHLWSRMFAAAELNAFTRHHTSLRLSESSSYLCIPHHISIFLNIAMALLHWLTTRSLHVVSIRIYNIAGQLSRISPVYGTGIWAAMFALVTSALLIVILAWGLERPLRHDRPVLGTCSLAISTACHE